MITITMQTSRAIILVESHRQAHCQEYELQMDGYQAMMDAWGEETRAWASDPDRRSKDRPPEPSKPQSFVDAYDDLIAVLDEHTGNLVTLDSDQAQNEVIHDRFRWTAVYTHQSQSYGSQSGLHHAE